MLINRLDACSSAVGVFRLPAFDLVLLVLENLSKRSIARDFLGVCAAIDVIRGWLLLAIFLVGVALEGFLIFLA